MTVLRVGDITLAVELSRLLPDDPEARLGVLTSTLLASTLVLRLAEHFGVPAPARWAREDIGFAGVVTVLAEVLEAEGRPSEELSAAASCLALRYPYSAVWRQIKDRAVQEALAANRVGKKPHTV